MIPEPLANALPLIVLLTAVGLSALWLDHRDRREISTSRRRLAPVATSGRPDPETSGRARRGVALHPGSGHHRPPCSGTVASVTVPGAPTGVSLGDGAGGTATCEDVAVPPPHGRVLVGHGGARLVAVHPHDPWRCRRGCCRDARYRQVVAELEGAARG